MGPVRKGAVQVEGGPGKGECEVRSVRVRAGAKIPRFFSSPDPFFCLVFPISKVFRRTTVVSARFHH